MSPSPKQHLPSFVTLLNLFAGFLSVLYSIRGEWYYAGWLIVIAAFLDALDGRIARLVKSSSEFGGELDSLADVASFGFAPSVLIYQTFLHTWGEFGMVLSFLPLAAGGIRLARFNVETTDHAVKNPYFKGLPIPSAAMLLTSFIMFEKYTYDRFIHTEWMLSLMVLACLLMVSSVRYDAPPAFTFKNRSDAIKSLIVILLLPLFSLYPYWVLFPFMLFFTASGIFRTVFRFFSNQKKRDREEESDEEINGQ